MYAYHDDDIGRINSNFDVIHTCYIDDYTDMRSGTTPWHSRFKSQTNMRRTKTVMLMSEKKGNKEFIHVRLMKNCNYSQDLKGERYHNQSNNYFFLEEKQ
jgi:hypothetical protein